MSTHSPSNQHQAFKSVSAILLVVGWFGLCAVPIAAATAWYHAPLPQPHHQPDNVVDHPAVPDASKSSSWVVMHLLAGGCPCSARLANLLLERGPLAHDQIVIIGEDDELMARMGAAGFRVSALQPADISQRYGVMGGPWLLITQDGHIRYSGGHGQGRPRAVADFQDRVLLDRLLRGEQVEAYAAFGCATDPQLQLQLDPFSWK